MRIGRVGKGGALLLALLALAGCGGGSMAEVSGTVTLDGKPIELGAIQFFPADGKSVTTGGAIKDGRYSVQVPIGIKKVSLMATKVVGKAKLYATADSPEVPRTQEMLPAKYNEHTELRLDVKPGTNRKDFELQSK